MPTANVSWPGEHWALEPAGRHAELVESLLWPMVAVSVVVFVGIAALLWIGIRSRRSGKQADRAGWRMLVLGGLAVPVLSIVALVVGSSIVDRRLGLEPAAAAEGATIIDVTGHMWWWEVEYSFGDGRQASGANEIHLLVDQPVVVRVHSADVIHSFWLPSLGVKMDAIPGEQNRIAVYPTRTGEFRGACAELCGTQHAHMAFTAVVHSEREYGEWLEQSARPTTAGIEIPEHAGFAIFQRQCASCHRIAGTPALGVIGPDLSHLASRRTLAAGTLPNSRGNLAGWILDPQDVKPGAFMPAQDVEPAELDVLLDYLETLE